MYVAQKELFVAKMAIMIGLLKGKCLKSFKKKLEVCLTERLNEFGVSAFGIFQMILSRFF